MPVRWVFSLNWNLKLEQNLLTINKMRYEGCSVNKIPYVDIDIATDILFTFHESTITINRI